MFLACMVFLETALMTAGLALGGSGTAAGGALLLAGTWCGGALLGWSAWTLGRRG